MARSRIKDNGVIPFQNTAGVTVENFLMLLHFYLNNTFTCFDQRHFLQNKGICIGSCVVLILCNIFLSDIDRSLEKVFNTEVEKCFRYMDDFLIILGGNRSVDIQDRVQALVNAKGLSFTYELPDEKALQFLDVNLRFLRGHTCWMYSPRARKELLQYNSDHSKLEGHSDILPGVGSVKVVLTRSTGGLHKTRGKTIVCRVP